MFVQGVTYACTVVGGVKDGRRIELWDCRTVTHTVSEIHVLHRLRDLVHLELWRHRKHATTTLTLTDESVEAGRCKKIRLMQRKSTASSGIGADTAMCGCGHVK